MLPKQHRLPGFKIPDLLNSKATFQSPFFGLKTTESNHSHPRIGFIVSTKIAKNAVDRNRIKRLLREAIKPHLQSLKLNHDFLFLAKHPIKGKSLKEIKPHVSSLLKKTKLLSNEKTSS